MDLTVEQEQAIETLVKAFLSGIRSLTLAGPAGSGKTFIMRRFAERVESLGYKTKFLASTGKAANRLSVVSSREVSTIHQVLYKRSIERQDGSPAFFDARPPCDNHTVIVVDEASMVDLFLKEELEANLPADSAVLYCGDPEQLPPVSGNFGPDLLSPTARLETIHRQAEDNPILAVATAVRLGNPIPKGPCKIGTAFERKPSSLKGAADWLANAEREGRDAVLLCWTNQTRRRLNEFVRKTLGFDEALVAQDRLVILNNNKKLKRNNGEVLVIDKVTPFQDTMAVEWAAQMDQTPTKQELESFKVTFQDGRSAFVEDTLFGRDLNAFKKFVKTKIKVTEPWHWLFCDYGHALTIHKSQGSEYAEVGIVIDDSTKDLGKRDPKLARQLAYTAITRGKQKVVIFDVAS